MSPSPHHTPGSGDRGSRRPPKGTSPHPRPPSGERGGPDAARRGRTWGAPGPGGQPDTRGPGRTWATSSPGRQAGTPGPRRHPGAAGPGTEPVAAGPGRKRAASGRSGHRQSGRARGAPLALLAALVLALTSAVLFWHGLGDGRPGPGSDPGTPPGGDQGGETVGSPGAGPGAAPEPAGDTPPPGQATPSPPAPRPASGKVELEVVARDLEVPWDLAFDREGRLFFTERPGRIRLLDGGRLITLLTLPDTAATGEGGLLGLALHPAFPEEPWVYVYQTYRGKGRGVANRVLRFRFVPGGSPRLTGRQVILDGIPGAAIHDGGQLEFGPDGKLYVTTGDARAAQRAQDPNSLHGKILRLEPDGRIPADNPLGPDNPVFSYGHRNPEGLAFHPATGALYAIEHGPEAWDEINHIQPGGNYGWPEVTGPGHGSSPRFIAPLRAYSPVIAPAGADFYRGPIAGWDGSLFVGTLGFSPDSAGRHLRRLRLADDGRRVLEEEPLFKGEFGRIRAVKTGPDGCLYFGTSNRDGRGEPRPGDDRILRACPAG